MAKDFQPFRAGCMAIAPILPSVLPFALIAGVAAVDAGLSPWAAMGLSLFVFAGASQLALIQLFDVGAAGAVMLMTALVINLRFAMYSAGLAPLFHGASLRQRLLMGYVLSDQAFALCTVHLRPGMTVGERMRFYFGISAPIWLIWELGTLAGALLGTTIPKSWSLDFAIPLMFLGLLLLSLRSASYWLAALVGGGIAVYGHAWPYNSGLIIGAVCGVLAGWLSRRLLPLVGEGAS